MTLKKIEVGVEEETSLTNPTERLNSVLEIVEDAFNLPENHDFSVIAFVDKKNKCAITLANRNFEFSVVIKNPEDFAL